jgi:hypothetical protein
MRRCDESAAFTLLRLYCAAQVTEEAAESREFEQCDRFFQDFCGVLSGIIICKNLQTGLGSGILLQRGIAIFDCEAAALPGRFLPELGRSSERPFFFAPILWPVAALLVAHGLKPTSLLAPGHGSNSLAQKRPAQELAR